jgi:hypothetical protein
MCSGTPVCAFEYACAAEQVQPGVTGRLFTSGSELASIWAELLPATRQEALKHERGYSQKMQALQSSVRQKREAWHEQWLRIVPALLHDHGLRL